MDMSRAEIDEMLRRADEQRQKLRRASRELITFGEQVLRARDEARGDRDLEDARSVVEKQRGRLDDTLMEREIVALAGEITDHDIRGRFDKIVA